jgi:hypothetical protein
MFGGVMLWSVDYERRATERVVTITLVLADGIGDR